MQKRVKKLKLAKETVRSLDTPELRKAAGAIVYTDDTICCRSGDYACLTNANRVG